MNKKDKFIHLKVTSDERLAYIDMANNLNMPLSQLIRLRLADTQPPNKQLQYEINKIGNNLNQIARALNANERKIDILKEMIEIENILKDLV